MAKNTRHSELVSETNKGGESLPLARTSSLATPSSGGHPRNAPVESPIETPYELPEGWKWERLGNICDLLNGFAFKSTDYVESSNVMNFRMSQIRPGGFTDLYHNTKYLPDSYAEQYKEFLLKDGDIVIAMTDMANDTKILGVPSIVYTDGYKLLLNQRVGKLFNISKTIDSKFLNYMMVSPYTYNYYKSLGKGGLQLNLGKSDILNAIIPLPPTLAEQQRIVNRIETMFAKLDQAQEKAQTVLDNFELRKAAILHKAFTGELTANWRKENGVSDDSWEEKKLGEIASKITDGEHSTPRRVDEFCGYYLLSARNIHNGAILLDDVDYVTKEEYERIRKRCNPDKNDILISCSGSVGRVCVIQDDNKYVMVRSAAMVKLEQDNPFFVAYMLQSFNVQQQIERTKKQSCQANLFLGAIKELEIPVSTLPEQQEIVRILDSVLKKESRAKEAAQTVLEQIALLKKSILAKAFRGEL